MSDTASNPALSQGSNFVWHELYVPDDKAAMEFYEKALGFGSTSMDMGEMGSYQMMTRDGIPICGVMNTSSPQFAGTPPHWSTYLSVDDVDERLKVCASLGAKIIVQPLDVPTVGRMALIEDPQGAHIWLFKSAR